MDRKIKKIMQKLQDNGYQAFLVGGYVRDQLLGSFSSDVDICTDALPKDVHNLFNINCKNNYGGSNIKLGKYNVDITTFRKEIKYVGRKPVEMEYINDLEEDLKRRDFTVNAICMDIDGKIIDYLNGINDLNNRLLRSIGDSYQKLEEDPLRILRTIRFATTLKFDIESKLEKALINKVHLVQTLSNERIKQEFSKILRSTNYKKGLQLIEKYGIKKLLNIEYNDVVYTKDLIGMWAQIKMPEKTFTNQEKSNIIKITEIVKEGIINDYTLYQNGLYISSIAAEIMGINTSTITKRYNKLPIKSRKDIKLTVPQLENIISLSSKGKIKSIYQELEWLIISCKLENDFAHISEYIEKNKGKW